MAVDPEQEEIRFHKAIAESNLAVGVVVAYLRGRGYEVEQTAATVFVDRKIFPKVPESDLRYRRPNNDRWYYAEVKGRTLRFSDRESFPYPTIIIDRATKGVFSDIYFSVSADLSCAAIVTVDTKPQWVTEEMFDNTKGYSSTNFLCPIDIAVFIDLRPNPMTPQPAQPAPPPTPIRKPFEHYCPCGQWGSFGYGVSLLRGEEGMWFCGAHRPAYDPTEGEVA